MLKIIFKNSQDEFTQKRRQRSQQFRQPTSRRRVQVSKNPKESVKHSITPRRTRIQYPPILNLFFKKPFLNFHLYKTKIKRKSKEKYKLMS